MVQKITDNNELVKYNTTNILKYQTVQIIMEKCIIQMFPAENYQKNKKYSKNTVKVNKIK